MTFTIVGATGFIGGALVAELRARGHAVATPARGDDAWMDADLGHVIHAAGVTADFRSRPFATIEANTTLVAELLRRGRFDSLLYLSSSRVYRRAGATAEDTPLCVRPADPDDLYDISKLAGEAICHASGRAAVRVARLANVVGRDFASDNFLFQLIRAACDDGRVQLQTAADSAKDYVLIDDVVGLLIAIAEKGRHACYNVGSGANLSHAELLAPILAATGATLKVAAGAPSRIAPVLDTGRARAEFGFAPGSVLAALPDLIRDYRKLPR